MPIEILESKGIIELSCEGQSVILKGELFHTESDCDLTAQVQIEKRDFTIFSLELTADKSTQLQKVSWFSGEWEQYDEKLIHSTELQDNFLILRKGNIAFFLSLDFPSSSINQEGITYKPYDQVIAGVSYHCHSVSVGACLLSGVKLGAYDRAEIEAISSYIEQRFPLRFERPVTGITCITNGMTDVRDGRIFYSMNDNPTLLLAPEVLEREIDLCVEAGFEYYQVFEGVFDWPADDTKIGNSLHHLVKYGKDRGVRVGDYAHPGELYCPHYNYEQRVLDKAEWRQLDAEGKRGQLCLGCKDYAEFLREKLVEHNRKYNEQMICLDMLSIIPCYDTTHNHPPGDVYQQVRGLVELMVALSELHPEYLIWSNSGNWLEFMPKLVWYNPNIYLTDPHVREYSPNLNMLKLMGDTRREQMVTFHNTYFVPYRFYSNCEYYYAKRSRVSDWSFFEYSILQGFAVTPNLFMGEWRTFLERIPSGKRAEAIAFLKKWNGFIASNFDVWQQTKPFGDSPSIGGIEAYSHVSKDRGFLCFVNPNPFPGTIRFQLDGTVGLETGNAYRLYEIYPQECLIAEQTLPYSVWGESISLELPPHSVRYIEIKPYRKANDLQVFGLPASVIRTELGYRLLLEAPQGKRVSLKLLLPEDERVDAVVAQQVPSVPMFTFPTSAQLIANAANAARVEVTFPRIETARELTQWVMQPGNIEISLPQLANCPFLGGLVQGAYSENYKVWLDITVKKQTEIYSNLLEKYNELNQTDLLPQQKAIEFQLKGKSTHFETSFELPFTEWNAFAPGYGDDAVIELAFVDPDRVDKIKAKINGESVEVRRYAYATKKEWHSYYIVLTGNVKLGRLELSIEIEWAEREN